MKRILVFCILFMLCVLGVYQCQQSQNARIEKEIGLDGLNVDWVNHTKGVAGCTYKGRTVIIYKEGKHWRL